MKSDMQARGRRPLASCCENAVPGTPTVRMCLRARMADGAMAGTAWTLYLFARGKRGELDLTFWTVG